jgi:flagellar assembly protein FliH
MTDIHQNLIKDEDAAGLRPVPFQFEDVRMMAAKILKRAAEQAKHKLDAAGVQAVDIEKSAYDDGYKKGYDEGFPKAEKDGYAAGEKAAREAFEQKTKTLAPALAGLLNLLEENKLRLQAEAEADLLNLSLAVARRLVRRELSANPDIIRSTLREAIALATDRTDLVVCAHPEDVAVMEEELPQIRRAFTDLGKVNLVPDETLARGGLLIRGRENEVDMRLEKQLEAIESALLAGERRGEAFPETAIAPGEMPEVPASPAPKPEPRPAAPEPPPAGKAKPLPASDIPPPPRKPSGLDGLTNPPPG